MASTRSVNPIAFLLALVFAAGCGKEVGRIPFTAEGTGETTVTLRAGKAALWTDIDIRYVGDASLAYEVELIESDLVRASAECDPLGHMSVKIGWVETHLGSKSSRSGQGRMPCELAVPAAGTYLVRARLAFGQRPGELTLKQADLVIKQ